MRHEDVLFEITGNESNEDGSLHKLTLFSPTGFLPILPGQFLNLEVPGSVKTFLRRPISVADVIGEKTVVICVKRAGRATDRLCDLPVGTRLRALSPLGNGFPLPGDSRKKVLLVGGGIGMAPLIYLAKSLANDHDVKFLLGGRKESDIYPLDDFAAIAPVAISTEDGSLGEKGLVTANNAWLEKYDRVYCCGPLPMMKAVAKKCEETGVECFASLENKMACGLGACLCCVEDTKEGHRCVCSDGPVFNVKELKWI